jgi:hypothetical protein
VLAWEGYYEPGPVHFRNETFAVLNEIGDAVPPAIDLGRAESPNSTLDLSIER